MVPNEGEKSGQGPEKSSANREHLGKLLNQTLASDSNLMLVSGELEALEKHEKNESSHETIQILKNYFTRIFTLSVRCLPSKRVKKLESLMRKWGIYKDLQGPQIN